MHLLLDGTHARRVATTPRLSHATEAEGTWAGVRPVVPYPAREVDGPAVLGGVGDPQRDTETPGRHSPRTQVSGLWTPPYLRAGRGAFQGVFRSGVTTAGTPGWGTSKVRSPSLETKTGRASRRPRALSSQRGKHLGRP